MLRTLLLTSLTLVTHPTLLARVLLAVTVGALLTLLLPLAWLMLWARGTRRR